MTGLFEKYFCDAESCYNEEFINKQKVLHLAKEALLDEANIKQISEFLDAIDSDVKKFMWQYYYILFKTKEEFFEDKWVLNNVPFPEDTEKRFPGMINAVVFLLAKENLDNWLNERQLPSSIGDAYFERYRYFVSLNLISDNTYGLCRLYPFLYSYAKPYILKIGRLSFELTTFKDYCEVYEDAKGNRTFVALPNYKYNKIGLMDDNGNIPTYNIKDNKLYAHTYNKLGRVLDKPFELDLNEHKKILTPGDIVVTIHIPEGGKLDTNEVKKSIFDANEIFSKHFRKFKCFVCHTWFIDPALRGKVIKEDSNMALFADLFDVISGPNNQNHSLFEHIFKVKPKPIVELEPVNGFQERILNYVKSGNNLYWSYGVLRKDI